MTDESNSYLWDKSGEADPEIARLEGLLGRYRHDLPMNAQPLHALPQARSIWRRWHLRVWAPALAVAALAAVFFFGVQLRLRWRPGAPWKAVVVAGAPRVGNALLGASGLLPVGEYLETDAGSSARLDIGRIGTLDVQPNSRLQLVETTSGRHRVSLEHGTVEARVWAPPFSFAIETPSSTLFDLGCHFTLHVEPNGYGVVRVDSGWVQFAFDERQSLIPAGAEAVTRPGSGPGTPYWSDAPPLLKAALAQFDGDGDDPAAHAAMLDAVLANARPRDAFTLMNLMHRVPREQRGRVFDKLAQFVPPPKGVTRDAVIELQEPAISAYWHELGLGNPKSWMVHWKDSLGM